MARISDSVGLSDNHAILLEDSLKESRIMREKVVERDEESILKFQGLSSKVDRLCQILDQKQTERNSRNKKGSKIYVPTGCRTEFRRMYKSLMEDDASFQGFYLEESASSTRNKAAFAVVAEAVKNDHGGEEECPWSTAQLRAAFLTYLRSLKDTQKRRRVPGKVEHKIVCRRQGRVREKIARRISAINGMDWDDTKKERCCKFLTFDYTSSDKVRFRKTKMGRMRRDL